MNIYVFDTNLSIIGIVDIVESMIWVDRYQGYGDFELYTNFTPTLSSILKSDYYLRIKGSENMMIIESVEIKTDAVNGNKLLVKGRSLLSILDRRIIFQKQVYTGSTVQNAISDILTRNGINSPGNANRNISGLIFTPSVDPLITTPTITAEYYTQEVYETIRFLCERCGFGYKLILNNINQFVFSLYVGQDRSYNQSVNPFVVFSPTFDNLISSDYFHSKNIFKNVALISGSSYNNGPIPTIDYYEAPEPSGLNRRETFVDASDLQRTDENGVEIPTNDYNAMMYERAKQDLKEHIIVDAFSGEANTTFGYTYGVDFFLGDIVQLEDMFGNAGRARIKEIIISETLNGTFMYPTFESI